MLRLVQRRAAGDARVDAGRVGRGLVLVVLAREGGFGALFADHAELLCRAVSVGEGVLVWRLTWAEHGLPLAVRLLNRVSHLAGRCCAEQGAEYGDGHGRVAQ